VVCRSLFVFLFFFFGHCVVSSPSIYGFWLPLLISSNFYLHFSRIMFTQKLIPRNTFVLILCYPIYHIYWNVRYNFWEEKMRLSSCFFEKCTAEISVPYSIFRWEFLLPRLLIFCIFMYALLVYRQNKTGILISCWKVKNFILTGAIRRSIWRIFKCNINNTTNCIIVTI